MSGSIQTEQPGAAGIGRAGDPETAPPPAALEGRYRGERVVALGDQNSLLRDAAEELTFQHGEKEEKSLARRTIRQAGSEDRLRSQTVQRVQDVIDRLGDLRKSTLDRVLLVLLQLRHADAMLLRQQVREQLPEPGHQYAALLALTERLREEGAPAERIAAAAAALRDLEAEQGPAIRAALNISAVAAGFAGSGLGELQQLRETYRDTILDWRDLSQTLTYLIEQHGEAELPRAIQYLLKALGADLAADGASIDPYKLNALLNDLYRLEVLTGLLGDCATLIARHRAPDQAFRGTDLLRELLSLQGQQWLRPELIQPLPARLGVRHVSGEINFLREFKELARMIPLKAYPDPDQRVRLLEAIQQAMDAAITREEAEDTA